MLTPDHLTGEREVVFIGREVDESSGEAETVASATTASTSTSERPLDTSGYDEMGW